MYVIVDQSVACIYSVLVSVLANLYAFLLFIRLLSCVITGSSHFSVKTGRCSEKEQQSFLRKENMVASIENRDNDSRLLMEC